MATRTRTLKPRDSALGPLPADAVLLALDVSSSAIGWSVFRAGRFGAAGLIRSGSRSSVRRIEVHTVELGEVAESYGITRAVMEWQSPWRAARLRNANGLAVLGQAQGAAWWELHRRRVPVDCVSEREWTKLGGWPASKAVRAERVRLLCREYRETLDRDPYCDLGMDIADSVGVGIWRLGARFRPAVT